MKKYIILLSYLLFHCSLLAQISEDIFVKDVSNPVIILNSPWKICLNPSGEFWKNTLLDDKWKDIQVPGEAMMQGYPIKHDEPFVYKKTFKIPLDFEGRAVKLRFEGVYSYARVWVNGIYIRDHQGGFTTWDCDISSAINPGDDAILTVEVTDRADEISYASGYAKHQIGGILRNVSLLALPVNYPENITIKTDLDENFQHASLIISGKIKNQSDNSKINLELLGINNNKIKLENFSSSMNNKEAFQIINHVNNPEKWDAEHPNLYSLKISFIENDTLQWQKIFKIGFREITINGNKLLVNGKEVKLRGACRHDIHPLLGRVSTQEYELKDVLLAKEANMNFIRTSHYPPSENFLRLCDEYGLYIEDETAVCFVGSHRIEEYRPGSTESDPDFKNRYLSQLKEMVTNHKNHPCIILWSIGNENSFGINFKKSYDWVKENDDTRPVIFSYPGNVPDSIKSYEILSMHYPDITGNLNQYGIKTDDFGYSQMPVIFDEWAHVACYNNFTVKEDPNIRDFWGRSLDIMWQKVFESDGGLGGAIWGMIDETFMLPDTLPGFNEWWGKIDKNVIPAEYSGNTIGYGEWGIVDTWRRKKPEFWNTKKAYSPVKLLKTEFENYSEEAPLSIPLYNRFDHTNIEELEIKQSYKGQEKILNSPTIEIHTKGILEIPMKEWDPAEPIILEFFNRKNMLIDKYALRLNSSNAEKEEFAPLENIQVEESRKFLSIICVNNTKIIFNKKTGLLHEIQKASGNFSLSGPSINLRSKGKAVMYSYHQIDDYGEIWQLQDFNFEKAEKYVTLKIKGKYNKQIPVEFTVVINTDASIKISYQIAQVPQEFIREIGIKFELEDSIDSLSWTRNSYWSYYPPDHLSSQTGNIPLYTEEQKTYRTKPDKDWNLDSKSFYYDGIENELPKEQLTYIAKSTKENISEYNLCKNSHSILSVLSNGSINCRLAKKEGKILLYVNNEMDYIDLSWGNFQRNIKPNRKYSGEVFFSVR